MLPNFLRPIAVLFLSGLLVACAATKPRRVLDFDTLIYIDNVPLKVVVFDTQEERELGLMHVDSLPKGAGALFVFEKEGEVRLWMKNMRFAVDMLFFDGENRLRNITKSVEPCYRVSCTLITMNGVAYLIEVGSGFSDKHGLDKKGSTYKPLLRRVVK